MDCTCPHRWPVLFPRSRNQRPPGHGSIFIGIGVPFPALRCMAPICSMIVSNTISIGAAIFSSLYHFECLNNLLFGKAARHNYFSLSECRFLCQTGDHLAFGPLLDPVEVVSPEALILLHPVVYRLQLLGIQPVKTSCPRLVTDTIPTLRSTPRCFDTAGWGIAGTDHVADRVLLAIDKQVDNFAPARFGDRIEYVSCCSCSGHQSQYIPIWEYVKR